MSAAGRPSAPTRAPALKILLVEDDRQLSSILLRALAEEGHAVDLVEDGGLALTRCLRIGYDVVLLDWMLPSIDGLSVCRALRAAGSTVAILMLTARTEVQERIAGLDAGADDFLPKPFDLDELLARVRTLGRRCRSARYLEAGAMRIDRLRRVAMMGGELLDLTPREFLLLQLLVSDAGRVVTRADILQKVWTPTTGGGVVEVNVKNLRTKLGEHEWRVETVRGIGYRWRDTE
ncbi:response regulator transcription factor [Nannocystis sp. ILAH1]|uniref:response regulator transcription factor n=1 Tax=Nannocystis sp. ILAH1 TaxID=2996789 RepID=UPI00226E9F8F|nr:response regulator transcription factor [Nannocystis sp. ILAH1]MCY0993113.1 response regulator transcription factor [Nannocystis sp. ILAH1]